MCISQPCVGDRRAGILPDFIGASWDPGRRHSSRQAPRLQSSRVACAEDTSTMLLFCSLCNRNTVKQHLFPCCATAASQPASERASECVTPGTTGQLTSSARCFSSTLWKARNQSINPSAMASNDKSTSDEFNESGGSAVSWVMESETSKDLRRKTAAVHAECRISATVTSSALADFATLRMFRPLRALYPLSLHPRSIACSQCPFHPIRASTKATRREITYVFLSSCHIFI